MGKQSLQINFLGNKSINSTKTLHKGSRMAQSGSADISGKSTQGSIRN